ncbi:MAG TPA: hypothetical protein ENI81_06430, partial [Phycisphaerales bacterium]|nr:hypothetical protein [Phycisphaerales bacterium]
MLSVGAGSPAGILIVEMVRRVLLRSSVEGSIKNSVRGSGFLIDFFRESTQATSFGHGYSFDRQGPRYYVLETSGIILADECGENHLCEARIRRDGERYFQRAGPAAFDDLSLDPAPGLLLQRDVDQLLADVGWDL